MGPHFGIRRGHGHHHHHRPAFGHGHCGHRAVGPRVVIHTTPRPSFFSRVFVPRPVFVPPPPVFVSPRPVFAPPPPVFVSPRPVFVPHTPRVITPVHPAAALLGLSIAVTITGVALTALGAAGGVPPVAILGATFIVGGIALGAISCVALSR